MIWRAFDSWEVPGSTRIVSSIEIVGTKTFHGSAQHGESARIIHSDSTVNFASPRVASPRNLPAPRCPRNSVQPSNHCKIPRNPWPPFITGRDAIHGADTSIPRGDIAIHVQGYTLGLLKVKTTYPCRCIECSGLA